MARDRVFDVRRLDVRAFAAAGAAIRGETAQAELLRLTDSVLALPGDSLPPPVAWSARGERRQAAGGAPEIRIHLLAQTQVVQLCQRCLQPMHEPLQIDRWFRFVNSEDEAGQIDDESEDDVLVASRAFDLTELLEDELILALPIVPRHAQCPNPLPMAVADEPAEEEAPNPFASLAALRRPSGAS